MEGDYHSIKVKLSLNKGQKATLNRLFGCCRFVLEDLNTNGMMKNHKLAKAIQDVSWFEIERQINYKSKKYGITVFMAGRFFASSKQCSHCKNIKHDLTLKDRVYVCTECGLVIDRDVNAAINLENLYKEQIGTGCPKSRLAG